MRTAKTKVKKSKGKKGATKIDPDTWNLTLYVAGQTLKSMKALDNLQNICETHLKDKYKIQIIDLMLKPQLAKGDQILAVPTLVRRLPPPIKKIIGDLSNSEKVIVGLNIKYERSK